MTVPNIDELRSKSAGQLTRREMANYLLAIRRAGESFLGWCNFNRHRVVPATAVNDPWPQYQLDLIETIDQIEKSEGNRYLITMPPGSMKSSFVSRLAPPYFIGRNPARKVLALAYGESLVKDFSKAVQSMVLDPVHKQIFPDFEMSKTSTAADDWTTTAMGEYFATSTFGTITGKRPHLLLLDDPIKNQIEADSATYRNRLWNAWVSDIGTRPLHTGNIIIVVTRWNPDDLAGRIEKSAEWEDFGWKHMNIQAIQSVETDIEISRHDLPPDDPRYRPAHELGKIGPAQRYVMETTEKSYWPEVHPLPWLKTRQKLNAKAFSSLYQQMPYVDGGNMIKSTWWNYYIRDSHNPLGLPPEINVQSIIIGWDTAFKANESNDYSVAFIAALASNGNVYVLDIQRKKLIYPDLKRLAIKLNVQYRGKGLMGHYIEDKASGQSLIQDLKTESGISVIASNLVGSKTEKVSAILPMVEGGTVFLPQEAEWLDDFVQECVEFPSGSHDDQVDAMAITLFALSRMTLHPNVFETISVNPANSLSHRVAAQSQPEKYTARDVISSRSAFPSLPTKNWKGWGE